MFDFDFEKWEEENPYPVIEDSDGISKTLLRQMQQMRRLINGLTAYPEGQDNH